MATGQLAKSVYYNISNGKVVRQFQEPTRKSIERVNKNGRKVHEEFYDFIDGYIVDVGIKEHEEFGKYWNVLLKDDNGTLQTLQFKYSSGYATAFLKALPNVDFTKKAKLVPSAKKEGDKTKTTVEFPIIQPQESRKIY